ncbi:amphiphysin-like isoform X7 [Ornithodoros turicata]|uniref:amphiphysin-like isoform X7 n=1 Tax=Ornithodoros turicata TaxID=34597 RepID=UPI0031389650
MADGKGGSFTKVVQKHAGRAKERILQNLGRADKTKDEVFEVYMYNFSRQQNAALKLQKEFKNYVMCIKGLQLASKALMDTLSEIYEQEWVGHEQIPVKAQTLELLWEDYHRKINDQVMMPLNSYITQFADVRGRIAKRGRKLVDYDKCRHSVESLRNSAKKKDDYKLGKAREELEQAKQMYEIINNELHDELPALYDSRIPFLVSNLQTFFSAEGVFHGENSKVFTFLMETMQKLSTESEKSGIKFPPITLDNASPRSYGLQNSLVSREVETRPYEEIEFRKEPECVACGTSSRMKCIWLNDAEFSALGYQPWQCLRCAVHGSLDEARRNLCIWFTRVTKLKANYSQWHWKRQGGAARLDNEDMPGYRGSYAEQNGGEVPVARKREEKEYEPVEVGAQMKDHTEDLYDIPVGATTTDLPSGVLYRVRATYKYTAEDVDELNFESGELIRVVEYEDPEEQEEGWLMGIKESTGEKGLFPANFTRPI